VDENADHLAGGGVAAHHDTDVAARLEDQIEDPQAAYRPRRDTLENQVSSTYSSDDVLY
jgi:hypothetical protein